MQNSKLNIFMANLIFKKYSVIKKLAHLSKICMLDRWNLSKLKFFRHYWTQIIFNKHLFALKITFRCQMCCLNGNARCVIAGEESRIQINPTNNARRSQFNDTPIVARRSSSARLPTIHPLSIIGIDVRFENRLLIRQQIFRLREPIVRRKYDFAAALKVQKNFISQAHAFFFNTPTLSEANSFNSVNFGKMLDMFSILFSYINDN